jgi:hypothetical protein
VSAPTPGANSLFSRLERRGVALALVGVVFALLAIERAVTPVSDPDSFWIAAAGREMWATHHAPRENLFSFTAPAHPWVFHELGFGVVYGKGLEVFGASFLDLIGILAGAFTIAIALFHIARTTCHRVTLALIGVPLLVELPLFFPRPRFVTLGLVAAMIALAFGPRFRLRHAVAAVVVEWVWTLSHGSFPLGVLLLVLALFEEVPANDSGRRQRLGMTAAAALLVTVLNPHGLGLHGLVSHYLVGDDDVLRLVHRHIVEFRPIWFAPLAAGSLNVPSLALATLVAIACLRLRTLIARAGFVVIFCVMGALAVRNVPIAVLLCGMLLAPAIDSWIPTVASSHDEVSPRAALLTVVPGVVVSTALWASLLAARPSEAWLGPMVGGPDALALLARIPDGARVYAPFSLSPLVIWYGQPRGIRVFYDPRNDCYPADVALDALRFEFSDQAAVTAPATLLSYGTEYALARVETGVEGSLSRSESWRLDARRGALVLFARRP